MFNINKYRLQEEEGGGEAPAGSGGMMGGGEAPAAEAGGEAPTGWSYAENVAGEGDAPDWFMGSKYKSVSDQAKAYGVLEERFRGFTGAPDEYVKPEGFTDGEAGIFASTISEIAKDSNMNQETYNKILESVVSNIDGYRETYKQEQMEAAIKDIPNFEVRRQALAATAQASLTTEQFDGLNELMSTASGFEAVEALTTMIRGGTLPGNKGAPQQRSAGDIMAEINTMDGNDRGRGKLIDELNKSGGAGKLV